MAQNHDHKGGCSCCSAGLRAAQAAAKFAISRREMMAGLGSAAIGAWAMTSRAAAAEANATTRPAITPADEIVVQPVLTYAIPKRREQTSWRPWGGIQTAADVAQELERIKSELNRMVASAGLPVKLLPVAKAESPEQAQKIRGNTCDVMLIYAAGNSEQTILSLMSPDRPTLFFLRHLSGPVSLYYEILHPRFLRKASDQYKVPGVSVDDVVVDDCDELAWRLRALAALRKTVGQKIIAIGGAGGWGEGHNLAPKIAREKWHLEIIDVSYPDLGKRIEKARADTALMAACKEQAEKYLADPGVTLRTDRQYVLNSFVLYHVFREAMKENGASAMTIQHCMGTVMPISKTTACLPLSLINDEGLMAFCESDFVVIPAGMLMKNITGLPVFLNDPTWPHDGIVTIAHCTAPRKMDGRSLEPVELHTHFESDYGASPKVAMRVGQLTTNVVPDFASRKFVGFVGKVVSNPFLPICRSQTDITVDGDWKKLVEDMRGFHWLTIYGDCRKEFAYAIKQLGIEWEDVSA